MDSALYVGLSAQTALRRHLDVIAHNLANMNTAGFRAERMIFSDFMARSDPKQPVAFVIDRATYTDARQGGFHETGNRLDVAIRGDGWLAVQTEAGIRYTRDGRLNLNDVGELVTTAGQRVLSPDRQPIVLPASARQPTIAEDGTLFDGNAWVGRIGLFRVEQPDAMQREADGLYTTAVPAVPAEDAEILQGMVEDSNVQPILAMTEMMEVSRAYQAVSQMVENADDTQRNGINKIGRVS